MLEYERKEMLEKSAEIRAQLEKLERFLHDTSKGAKECHTIAERVQDRVNTLTRDLREYLP